LGGTPQTRKGQIRKSCVRGRVSSAIAPVPIMGGGVEGRGGKGNIREYYALPSIQGNAAAKRRITSSKKIMLGVAAKQRWGEE